MKRIICLALVVVLCLTAFVACGDKEKEYTLGLGVQFGEVSASQTNATVATVVLDKDGKIVLCRIDAIQNKYAVADGAVTFSVLDTKMELGDNYKMAAFGTPNVEGGTVKEWYDQAKAFENYVVGKTAAEVQGIQLQEVNGHQIAVDESLLNAGCTIQITDFIAAVVKACNDDQKVTFKTAESFTLGVAANNADNGSTVADGVATVKMNSDIAAVVVADGKILATLNDAIQPQVVIGADGVVTSTSVGKGEGVLKTKRELKEDYKMAAYGTSLVGNASVAEWYLQSAAFSAHVVGKTADQVKNLELQTMDNGYKISNDQALLGAGCTMSIDGIIAVVVEAISYAR